MAKDRISVRLDKEKIEFLEQVGHDATKEKGARTRGVEAVIAFAQMTPRAFRAFLNGRQIADLNPCDVGEGCFKCVADQCDDDGATLDDIKRIVHNIWDGAISVDDEGGTICKP